MPDGKSEASGTFQLEFKSEKPFSVFGQEYARCYANFDARGEFTKPIVTGPLKYEIGFNAECECDTVLSNFRLAYERTYKRSDATELLIRPLLFISGEENDVTSTDDYSATLLTCSIRVIASNLV